MTGSLIIARAAPCAWTSILSRRYSFLRRRSNGRRRRNRDVLPHRIQLLGADSAHGKQIFHPMKSPALLPQVDDPLSRHCANARQFLQLFYIRNIEIDRFRWRIFFGASTRKDTKRASSRLKLDADRNGMSLPKTAFDASSTNIPNPKNENSSISQENFNGLSYESCEIS